MDTIRSRPAIVASNIERFVIEVGTKFIARPEERLLNVVHSLLQRCYKLPLPQQADVPEYMKKELQTVCDACLSHEMQVSWRRRGMLADVRESFVGDVQPQRTTTLKQLMDSLKVRARCGAPADSPCTEHALCAPCGVTVRARHVHAAAPVAPRTRLHTSETQRGGPVGACQRAHTRNRACSGGSRSCSRSARPSSPWSRTSSTSTPRSPRSTSPTWSSRASANKWSTTPRAWSTSSASRATWCRCAATASPCAASSSCAPTARRASSRCTRARRRAAWATRTSASWPSSGARCAAVVSPRVMPGAAGALGAHMQCC